MEYHLELGPWGQIFPVPCALVDRHLKLAGREQLQVLLWALRHAGEGFSSQGLAQALDLSEESAQESLEYWADRGLLAEASPGELCPVPQPEAPAPFAPAPPPAPAQQASPPVRQMPLPAEQAQAQPAPALPPRKRMVKPDTVQLAVRLEESEGLRFLMQEAENVLGKTLSPAMTTLLLTITDDYGLPPEVSVMLLHYAQEVGKTGTAYLDSVARDWAESGVFSLEAADAKLQDLSQRRLAWNKVAGAAGLPKRSPSKKEEEAALRWVEQWGFSQEMLSAAYERCVDNTGKFSAAYMDRVLESWHTAGVRNLEELSAHEEKKRAARQAEKAPSQPSKPGAEGEKSYDIDELARMSFFHLPKDL